MDKVVAKALEQEGYSAPLCYTGRVLTHNVFRSALLPAVTSSLSVNSRQPKHRTHGLLLDFAIDWSKRDDVLSAMTLVSARATPFDEIINVLPKARGDISMMKARPADASPMFMGVFARIMDGIPEEEKDRDESCWMGLGWSVQAKDGPPNPDWEQQLRKDIKSKIGVYNHLREDKFKMDSNESAVCRVCSKEIDKPLRCSGCSTEGHTRVIYCSPACQKLDWKPRHKAECPHMRAQSENEKRLRSEAPVLSSAINSLRIFSKHLKPDILSALYTAFDMFTSSPTITTHAVIVSVKPTSSSDPSLAYKVTSVGRHLQSELESVLPVAAIEEAMCQPISALLGQLQERIAMFASGPNATTRQRPGLVLFFDEVNNLVLAQPLYILDVRLAAELWEEDMKWVRIPMLGMVKEVKGAESWDEMLKRRATISAVEKVTVEGTGGGAPRTMSKREWDRWCCGGP